MSSRMREAACLKQNSSFSKTAVQQNRRVVLWNSHVLDIADSGPLRRAVQKALRKVSESICRYRTAFCNKSNDQHRDFFALICISLHRTQFAGGMIFKREPQQDRLPRQLDRQR